MAKHTQVEDTTTAEVSDRSQAISGPSSDLSSSIWLDMRSEKLGYLDAQPKRFSLSDSAAAASSGNANDAPLSIRTSVNTESANFNSSLPNIDFFDSTATGGATEEMDSEEAGASGDPMSGINSGDTMGGTTSGDTMGADTSGDEHMGGIAGATSGDTMGADTSEEPMVGATSGGEIGGVTSIESRQSAAASGLYGNPSRVQ